MYILSKSVHFQLRCKILNLRNSSSYLSYYHCVGKEPLKGITNGQLLDQAAKKYTDTVALVSRPQNKRITYQQLLEQSDKLAAALHKIGLQKGDRLGVWVPNMVEWAFTKFAAMRAGLILVSVNPMNVAKEIKYCINKVGMKALVCPDVIKQRDYYEILKEVAPDIVTSEPGKLNCKEIPSLQSIITISEKELKGTFNYNELMEASDECSIKNIKKNQHLIQASDPCCIQFSSGTTGQPKATVLTHHGTVNNAFCIGKRYELDKTFHIGCLQNPFFHVFGEITVLTSMLHFKTTVVIPSILYNPVESLHAIKEEKCSIVYGTPTMYVDLIAVQQKYNYDINPKIAVSGGAPCSPAIFEQMQKVLNVEKVKSIYGLTESTAVVFESLIDEDDVKATTTVGHVNDHIEVMVVDTNNNMVPFGTPGELCIRGYSNMLGYWNDPERTKEVLGKDRWLRTGDQFILYEDGYGKVVGRLKDMIVRGGENIFPKEIEDVLNTHPDIQESCVLGVPHERLGEEVCACVRLVEGSTITLESLTQYCKDKLNKHKIPTVLKVLDNFPKTLSGKAQKYILRQKLESKTLA